MSIPLLVPSTSGRHLHSDYGFSPERNRRTLIWGAALSKTAAEELLDWLENHGHGNCQVFYVDGEGFMVLESDMSR